MNKLQPESSGDVRRIRRLVAFLGIFLILLGQFLLLSVRQDESRVFPQYIWVIVLGIIIFLLSQIIPSTAFFQKISARIPRSGWLAWVAAALILSLLAMTGAGLFKASDRNNYISVLTVWLSGAFCYVAAFSQGVFTQAAWVAWWRKHRREILVVLVITALGAALRFYKLGEIPRVLDGDEGRVGLAAQTTALGPLSNPFALWDNFGALYLQVINVSLKFFGPTAFALRLVPAIGGVLAVPSIYLLARQIGGRRVAFIAAFLVATLHAHINFSRIASVAYIHGNWLAPLELYFLLSGLIKRQSWRTALSGVMLAIHFSIYLTAQVVIATIFVYMLIALIFLRSWFKPAWRQALAFWGGFFIMLLPEAYYILSSPSEFLNRLAQDGGIQNGWLAETAASTGHSIFQVLFGRVVHAFLALIYYPALDFYGSPAPTFSMILGSLFLIGLGLSLWRTRSPNYLLLNGVFWAATLAVGIFAVPPSADSYRMLMALPAALIMAAIGLDQTLEYFGVDWAHARGLYSLAVGGMLASLLIFNLWMYYGDFAGQCRFGNNFEGRFASYLGTLARNTRSESSIYLLSDNLYFYGSHASTDFLSQYRKITNFPDPIDTMGPVTGEVIVANPQRIPELEAWARAHPGGELHYQYDCQRMIMLSYQIP